jgi:broad specificity phosphatase PhoE
MKQLILIRHAESEHHVKGLVGGWHDFELSDLGHRQAQVLAARLAEEFGTVPCHLVCSDLKRSVQTATYIGQSLGVTPVPMYALREGSAGSVEGMTHQEARKHYLPPTEPLSDWVSYPGAESWRQVYERVTSCIDQLHGEKHDLVLVVSHQISLHLILCWWLGLDLECRPPVFFALSPAGLSVLHDEPWGGRTVACTNDVAHLYAAGLRTQ